MTSRGNKAIRYIAWFFSIAIMTLIFLCSSQNGDISSETSGEFITAVLNIFSDDFELLSPDEKLAVVDSFQFIVRKCAHFSIYFALGLSLMTAASTYKLKTVIRIFLSSAISLSYALSDEIHQTFVAGRAGTATDVLIDFSGAFTGILLILFIVSIFRHKKSRSVKKMRKKELMRRLSELVSTVEKLNFKVKELKAENADLKERLSLLENTSSEEIVEATDISDTETMLEPEGFTVKIINEVEMSEDSSEEPFLSDDALEYGACVIGKITVESARYCDLVSASDRNDLKELLGLIMGKSEVCKNEILNIAMSELSFESKREMIDAQFNEAVEYFNSVSQQ